MSDVPKKSVLCDLVTRHSDFDFEAFITSTPIDGYDHWNGFCLPMDYGDAAAEYDAIRNSCALFDASPMKKYRMRGKDAGAFLDRILTTPVSTLPNMKGGYGLLCNEDGYLLDDGITLKFSEDDYLLLISELDLDEHFSKYNDFDDLTITEETPLTAGFALQGPRACDVLLKMGFVGLEKLAPFELKTYDVEGHEVLLGRLGFTGDLGYEVWFPPESMSFIGEKLSTAEAALNLKIPGYGLSAVQVARLEAGMIVPGWDTAGEFQDLEQERTPFELSLNWNVKLKHEGDFVGKSALKVHKANGPRYKMSGFEIKAQCAIEDGEPLYAYIEGKTIEVGSLPSTAWHTAKKHWIGFASIKSEYAGVEDVFVLSGDERFECELCKVPFINLERRNQVPAPTNPVD